MCRTIVASSSGYVIACVRFEVQWHARLWHQDPSMITAMTSLVACEPCSICVSPSADMSLSPETYVHLDCNNNKSGSQLLRKCHNFSFFLLFLFVFGNIFYMIEIFRVIKSLLLCNSLVFFSFLFFIHIFALDISSTTVQFTPHTAWHFLFVL